MKSATIREVRAFVLDSGEAGADYHNQAKGHWLIDTPIANPMSIYERYKTSRTSWGINALGAVIVEVELENGIIGVGTSIGGEPACFIIERHLNRFIEGQDARNVELIWDQMWRATLNYGRKGLAIQALSAVDLAIWDCLGKLRHEPVYALIGGKTKPQLEVYATTARPEKAVELGFIGAKIPCPYGPADGEKGLKKNLDLIAASREAVGPDFPLMLDCYMSLDVPYAIRLAQAARPFNLKWVEECLPPDDYDGYAELKRRIDWMWISTGEHEYTRYGFRELIARRCADLLQPDINWVGGLTEALKIYAMASAYDIPCVPHGSSMYSYHLQIARTNAPFAEFLMMSPEADEVTPIFGELFVDEPLPKDGRIELSESPGWGVELNRSNLKFRRPYKPPSDSTL